MQHSRVTVCAQANAREPPLCAVTGKGRLRASGTPE